MMIRKHILERTSIIIQSNSFRYIDTTPLLSKTTPVFLTIWFTQQGHVEKKKKRNLFRTSPAITTKMKLLLVVLFSLSVLVSQTVGGRVKAPLLRQSNTNGLVFSKSFNSIYDTSMYGRLQLNNGLARTPQMGYVFNKGTSFFRLFCCSGF